MPLPNDTNAKVIPLQILRTEGQMFCLVVKMPDGMHVSHTGVSGFDFPAPVPDSGFLSMHILGSSSDG